jgi:hypothetical protein
MTRVRFEQVAYFAGWNSPRERINELGWDELQRLRELIDLAGGVDLQLQGITHIEPASPLSEQLSALSKLIPKLIEQLEHAQDSLHSRKVARTVALNLGCLVRHSMDELAREPLLTKEMSLAKAWSRRLEMELRTLARAKWQRTAAGNSRN